MADNNITQHVEVTLTADLAGYNGQSGRHNLEHCHEIDYPAEPTSTMQDNTRHPNSDPSAPNSAEHLSRSISKVSAAVYRDGQITIIHQQGSGDCTPPDMMSGRNTRLRSFGDVPYRREGVWALWKRVRRDRLFSKHDFQVLNRQLFIINILCNGLIYGVLFSISYKQSELNTTNGQKLVVLICSCGAVSVLLLQLICTVMYMLYKRAHHFVKSRGIVYIATIAACAWLVGACHTWMSIVYLGYFNQPNWLLIIDTCASQAFMLGILGAMVARQRLVFNLYEKFVYNMEVPRYLYFSTYTASVSWGLLVVAALAVTATYNQSNCRTHLDTIAICAIHFALLWLVKFSIQSRNIGPAYSDASSNIMLSIIISVVTIVVYTLRQTVLHEVSRCRFELERNISLAGMYLRFYTELFISSIIAIQLFGLVTVVVYFELELSSDLDPRQSAFATMWARNGEISTTIRIDTGTQSVTRQVSKQASESPA